ncbi:MAG: peptidoglycan synthetase [Bacteroidia bacterium]|nr:peptidoglycan synthetase [Bacteroidia bacterium]
MKVHFIAIGGSVMHNLAIALHNLGHVVSGSDDEIYEPASGRLAAVGLLPATFGWDATRIHEGLDAVIVGMHAKDGNPELDRARALGIKIWSFPEFLYQHSRNKQRVVICGSHGKTTITSMVMHVLKGMGRKFDYMAGGQVEGFDTMVGLSDDAPIIILEGDEYLASPLDRRPKFRVYQPHIALISGIAWDHINVFPTEAEYIGQFEQLVAQMPKAGALVYNDDDKEVRRIIKRFSKPDEHYLHPYTTPDFRIKDHAFELRMLGSTTPLQVIGRHNISNISGAWEVCKLLAVQPAEFLKHISTFKGAAKRLEKIHDDGKNVIYKDFAHSPSKVKATVEAVIELYGRNLFVACLELHTFSSLNKAFLSQYKKTLKGLKHKIVFIDAHTLQMKNYPAISKAELVEAFADDEIQYATNVEELKRLVAAQRTASGNVFLMMSSGNFAGQDLKTLCLGE